MGFLSKLLGISPPELKPQGQEQKYFPLAIVGESHYQTALAAICGKRKDEGENKVVEAALILDDANQYDNQAVRVEIEGNTVGHLSREDAREYRKRLAQRKVGAFCQAKILGGWKRGKDQGHYGVYLDLRL